MKDNLEVIDIMEKENVFLKMEAIMKVNGRMVI